MHISSIQTNTIQNNILIKRQEQATTNPILKQKETQSLPSPTSELLKAYNGIKAPVVTQKTDETTKEQSAYDYLLTLPNVKNTFKNELKRVADVMERMDKESSSVSMMVDLVAEGKLWRGVLRYFCDKGRMSEDTEQDIDLMYSAYAERKNPIDKYVPTVSDKESGLKSVNIGGTFEVEGEKNIYFKDTEDSAHQLKVSKETFATLFPPVERFAGVQGAAGDCYLLATINSILDKPEQSRILYDMFEETEDYVNVKMPNGEYTYSAPKNDLRVGIDKWQHLQGATGMILVEHTYGEELKHKFEKEFHNFMTSEIARMEKEEPQNKTKIEGYKKRLQDFDEKSKDPEYKPVLMRFENPEANGKLTFKLDENGIIFKDLKSANKEYRRKLTTQADFYRGSIGGDLDTTMKDFGYTDVKEYKPKNIEQEKQIKEILHSEEANKYIFTAGAISDGTLVEKPIAKEYSVYGCHAYKIEPFKDKDGSTKFFVENPWNSTQNSVMNYDKLKEFFEIICAVKVA